MGKVSSYKKNKLQIVSIVLFLVWTSVLAQSVSGATLNLTARWTANTELDMKEYRLYRTDGTRTLLGSTLHPNTSYPFTVTVQDGSAGTLTFVVRAVDTQDNESADSNMASYSYDLSPVAGTLSVMPTDGLTSSGIQGGPFSPSSKSYTLQNIGETSINWSASKGQAWVTLSSASGTLGPGASATVTVSINSNANSLTPGPYSDTVSFTNTTNGIGNTTRPVSVAVNTQYGVLLVTPSNGLTSSGIQGGPFSPLSKVYTLTNTGGSSINWTASKGQAWVTLSSASGTLGSGTSTTVTVSINSNANSLTPGPYSDTVSFTNTTNGNGNTTRPVSLTATSTVNSTVPPSPPTNVSANDGTYVDRVGVTWTASANATSYTVYRATKTYSWVAKTALGTATGTSFNDTTAVPMTTYYYWVKASNTYGTSGFSAYDGGYRSDGRPPAPTNVMASDGTYTDRVQVTWTASPNATSYTVYRTTSTYPWVAKTALGGTTNTTFDDTTASAGKAYYYWVKASNAYGTSDFSASNAGHR